jgi:serpin B
MINSCGRNFSLILILALALACSDNNAETAGNAGQGGTGADVQAGNDTASGKGGESSGGIGGSLDGSGGAAGSAGSIVSSGGSGQNQSGNGGSSGPTDTKPPETTEIVKSSKARLLSPTVTTPEADELKQGNTAFALDLYQVLSGEAEKNENLFFSPHSISVALAMTYAGARNNTETQMAEALHFTLEQDRLHEAFNQLDIELDKRALPSEEGEGEFRLNIVNAIWPQKEYAFLPEFLDVLAVHYDASLYLLDFAADPEGSRQVINEWVAGQTENRIKDLIPEGIITSITRLVLTNAIYFKAAWKNAFEESNIADGVFTRRDGSSVSVAMMNQTNDMFYAEGQGWKATELPYERPELGMAIILPDDFDRFESELSASSLLSIIENLESATVNIRMPRFSFESEFMLNEALKALGMTDAFSMAADFSGMNGNLDLFIQAVVHKAFIDVNEAGTEAAAATAVVVGEKGIPIVKEITLNKPFLFLIWDRPTGAILFIGRVVNPS